MHKNPFRKPVSNVIEACLNCRTSPSVKCSTKVFRVVLFHQSHLRAAWRVVLVRSQRPDLGEDVCCAVSDPSGSSGVSVLSTCPGWDAGLLCCAAFDEQSTYYLKKRQVYTCQHCCASSFHLSVVLQAVIVSGQWHSWHAPHHPKERKYKWVSTPACLFLAGSLCLLISFSLAA